MLEVEYLNYLKDKDIKCLVFKGSRISTKHQCNCGNIWTAIPYHVVRRGVNRCKSCSNASISLEKSKKVAEHYRKVVCKQKNLRMLEHYKTAKTPILHKCLVCSNKWKVKPNDVCTAKTESNRCPVCAYADSKSNSFKRKPYTLGNRKIKVQGYETLALDYIINKIGVKPKHIIAGEPKRIPIIYYANGIRYYPDIYIPKLNIIAEVKSEYTLGLTRKKLFELTQRKAEASIESGFKFKLLIMAPDGTRYKTPKNWTNLSWSVFVKEFKFINEIK